MIEVEGGPNRPTEIPASVIAAVSTGAFLSESP